MSTIKLGAYIVFGVFLMVVISLAIRPPRSPEAAVGTLTTLFTTEDGCIVRRFKDDGHYRYFARCPAGSNAGVSWVEKCGKHCTADQTLPTLTN